MRPIPTAHWLVGTACGEHSRTPGVKPVRSAGELSNEGGSRRALPVPGCLKLR